MTRMARKFHPGAPLESFAATSIAVPNGLLYSIGWLIYWALRLISRLPAAVAGR